MVDVKFTEVDGTSEKHDITLYALSTCGFCWRGLQFLRDNSIKFKYVHIDLLEYNTKQQLKRELFEKYKKRPVFPYLVIDDEKVLTGFRKENWEEELL